jgi:hypothetical protein
MSKTTQSRQSEESWRKTRQKVIDRDDSQCRFCEITNEQHKEKSDKGLSVHHIIPQADGGTDDLDNLIAVCSSCHRTLEETQGKALSQLKNESQDADETIEKTREVMMEYEESVDTADDELADWIRAHPVFCRNQALYIEGIDQPYNANWLGPGGPTQCSEINSEFEAAARYGWREGVLNVVLDIRESVSLMRDD